MKPDFTLRKAFFLSCCVSLALALLGLAQAKAPVHQVKKNRQGYHHWHLDDPEISFSIWWDKVLDEELVRYVEDLKRNPQQQSAGIGAGNVAWKIHVELFRLADGFKDLGWFWFGADTNMFALEQWGNPVVYDVRRLSSNSVSVLYGNKVLAKGEIREMDPGGGEMKLLRSTNWWRSAMPKRIMLAQPPFPQSEGDTVRKFVHDNNPITITASCEEAPPEQLIWDRWSVMWNLHFWSSGPQATNYLGWFLFHTTKGEPGIAAQGKPVIYDAMLVSPKELLVVYGDKIKTICETKETFAKDGYMGTYGTRTNGGCAYGQWPRSWYPKYPRLERAFLKAESPTNVVVCLVCDTGFTNRAVWQGERGWKKITPYLDLVHNQITEDPRAD